MHSTETENAIFIHDYGFDGDVTIKLKTERPRAYGVTIPMSELKQFFAEYIRSERISQLEQMETDELLGLDA
jgi:hypothetical protein